MKSLEEKPTDEIKHIVGAAQYLVDVIGSGAESGVSNIVAMKIVSTQALATL